MNPGATESTAAGNCTNAFDDDCDGLPDARDPDCASGSDTDGDTILDSADNCPGVPNPGQADADGDGRGDACDPCPADNPDDPDGDGACTSADNCPGVANPGQDDADGDGPGDACDACTDTDGDGFGDPGFPATTCPPDGCPADPDKSVPGICGCGVPDADADGDGVAGCLDCDDGDRRNFPGNAEDCADGRDNDCDGLADGLDPDCTSGDGDADGVLNSADNCVVTWNPQQSDGDGDGIGDACDPDDEVVPVVVSHPDATSTDVLLTWSATPSAPRMEYPFYVVYRGALAELRTGSPAAPNWTYARVSVPCVMAPTREFRDAVAFDGTDHYYLVTGWAATGEGSYGRTNHAPVGPVPGPEDVPHPPIQPQPGCP